MKHAVRMAAAVVLVSTAWADTLMLKDGTVLECKVLDRRTEEIHGQAKTVYVVEVGKGERRTFLEEEVAWLQRMRVSWEAREEALQWYTDARRHVPPAWGEQFGFAVECRRKQLYDQAARHFEEAYALRRRETPDTREGHEGLAEWLLKDCGLYGAATDEFRKAYAFRKADARSAPERMALGRWCEERSLFDEAEAEYGAALKAEPELAEAKKALENLQKLRLASFHPTLHRELKAPFCKSMEWLRQRQNGDGSFGADVVEAGVQGHRGVTALAGIAILNEWELSRVDGNAPVPPEVEKALDYFLARPPNRKALRGPDVWGNAFGIEFLVKCHKLREFRSKRDAIRDKLREIYEELGRMQGPDGGWMYYDFAKSTSASFVTAAMVVNMALAKREGVGPEDALIERAVGHLKRVRLAEANYTYRTGVRLPIEGNAARGPLCELAMVLTGNSTQDALRTSIENFFKYRHVIQKIKGQRGTHIGEGRTAPYYYLYGHYWMARAIKALDRPMRNAYLERLRDAILADQEKDGTFWDWPMFRHHKTCGTALGAMCLYQIMHLSSDRVE